MAAAITADELLAEVKTAAMLPSTDGRLSDADIYRKIDRLTIRSLGRAVYDADDGRWVKTAADVSITSGRAEYRIPTRAWASGVDSVELVKSGVAQPMGYVDRSEVGYWDAAGVWQDPRWTIIGDVIRLMPTPTDSSYSLRVRYVRRPSKLVGTASCAQISSLTASALTVASYPAGWTTDLDVDVVQAEHNVDALEDDVTVTPSGGTTLTRGSGSFATTGAYAISAGDYACEAGKTCVVQVPDVALGYLVELAARDVCVAIGDQSGAAQRQALATEAKKDVDQAIAERSRQRTKVINRSSPLRQHGHHRRRAWGDR